METERLEIVTPATAGDPMGKRQWGRRRWRNRRQRLAHVGHAVSAPTISRVLKAPDSALRVTAQEYEAGSHHPDRDTPFRDMEAPQQAFAAAGCPLISVETKKQALMGNFKNPGRAWCQQAEEVHGHDFLTDALGRAAPYGLFDPPRNEGTV
jgi:hypothetical protein